MFQILVIILFIILVIVLPLRGLGPVVYKGLPIEDKHFTAVIDGGCVLANGYKTFYLNRRSGILIVKMLSTALNNWKQQHFTVTTVFIITRSKPAYRWQGLGWDRGAGIQLRRFFVTNGGIQPISTTQLEKVLIFVTDTFPH